MFIDCPYCGFLVAIDEQGRPLPRCPNCAQRLRDDDAEDAAASPDDAAPRTAERLQPQADTPGAAQTPASPEVAPAATEAAKPAREDVDRELLVEAPPADAEDPQAARNDATDPAQPPVEAETASDPTEAAIHAPANPEHESKGETVPAGNAVANAVVVPTAETAPPAADANPETNPASDAPTAAIMATVAPATPPMPQGSAATSVAATPRQADATTDTTPPVVEEADELAVATAVADADVIAELVQREVPVEAEIESPIMVGAPATGDDTAAPVAERVVAESVAPAGPEVVAGTAPMPEPAISVSLRRPARPRATPSFASKTQAAAPVDRRRLLLRCSAVAALSLLLVLQLLLSERARLAADAGWRPLLASLCGVLRCSLPAWREPLAFELLERDVRAHPSLPGVLRVSARVRNGARWPQAWPVLQLTFSDVHGRSVATRLFQPREYLGGTPTQSVLGRGQVAGISMDVIEPGVQAVAFTFEFK